MNLLSITVMLILVFIAVILVASSRLPAFVKNIICVGLVLRVIGAALRYRIIFDFYTRGDATNYYEKGLIYAQSFKELNFSVFLELAADGKLWGTNFLRLLSGVALTFLGPSLFAEFILFALGAFVGLICFGNAFRRSNPDSAWFRYLVWIMLFPSLWFWTASVGKEAIVMLGLGAAVLGFVGKQQKIRWVLMLSGLFLTFAVRPEMAAVLLASMLIGQWFSLTGRWSFQKVIQTLVFSVVAIYGLRYVTLRMGIEDLDPTSVQSYVETDASRRATGKTNVTAVGVTVSQTPLAVVNVLFRPFPWEATNIMVLASSLEVTGFLIIVAMRRRNLMHSLRNWRSDRLLRLAVIFSILYPVGLGMMVVNMGIIARQRALLFPFLFVLIEAQPRVQNAIARKRGRPIGAHSPPARQTSSTSNSLPAPGTSLSRMSTALASQAIANV